MAAAAWGEGCSSFPEAMAQGEGPEDELEEYSEGEEEEGRVEDNMVQLELDEEFDEEEEEERAEPDPPVDVPPPQAAATSEAGAPPAGGGHEPVAAGGAAEVKSERVEANDPAEVNDDVAKVKVEVNDNAAQVKGDAAVANDDEADSNDDEADSNDDAAEANDDVAQVNDDVAEVNDDVVVENDDEAMVNDDVAEVNDKVAEVNDVSVEVNDDGAEAVADGQKEREEEVQISVVTSATPKPAPKLPKDELDRLLDDELPKAIAEFQAAFGQFKERRDILDAEEPVSRASAKRILQVVTHLRDLSWRRPLSFNQATKLGTEFVRWLPTLQTLLGIARTLDFHSALQKNDTEMAAKVAAAFGAALEAASSYCILACAYNAPAAVAVEDISVATVQSLKRCLSQVIEPFLNPKDGASVKADALSDDTHFVDLRNVAAALFRDLHEYLCRHRLGDDQLHQLIHLGLAIFFYAEPDFALCAAAEEALVTIFSRFDGMRSSMVQEILVKVPKLPSGKRVKKFRIRVAGDNPANGLSLPTHMILRLVQCMCLPLREPLGARVAFEALLVMRSLAQNILVQLAGGLVQRLLMGRSRDDDLRMAFDNLVDELLTVMFMPPWPGALALVRTLTQQLVAMASEKAKARKAIVDCNQREFSVKVLSKIVETLSRHHAEAKKGFVKLPPWTARAEQASAKDERILQHVALRVSLEEGAQMPWTEAARAVDAWDAELFLAHGDEDRSGLTSFTDEYVFRYLTLSHLEEQRLVAAKVPPSGATQLSLSSSIFASSHAIHAWSFMVCDWADSFLRQNRKKKRQRGAKDADPEDDDEPDEVEDLVDPAVGAAAAWAALKAAGGKEVPVIEKFLTTAWTSPTPLCGEGAGSLSGGGGRRIVLKFTVYKMYRQLRMLELEPMRRWALACLVVQAHSLQASLRKTSMRAISDIIDKDGEILSNKAVEETIDMRLRDESAWVRQVSLDVLGRVLEGSIINGDIGGGGATAQSGKSQSLILNQRDSRAASAMLLRFHQTVRGRINDVSVLVRRQAARILSAFVLNHPEHPDVVEVCLDLLRRSSDSDLLKNQMLSTFELLWFVDDEPSAKAAGQLARVVDAAKSSELGTAPSDLLNQLLQRYQKNTGSKRKANSFEQAIRRWTSLLLNEFVRLNAENSRRRAANQKKSLKLVSSVSKKEDDDHRWMLRRSVLSTLESFAAAQPKHMVVHLRPLTVYLALEEESPLEEQWVAQKVCQILSAVLPYVAERRGLMDHRQVQQDLQMLIRNQGSTGVHEAVRCLCLVVTYVTGDLAQLVAHLNVAIPALAQLCSLAEATPGCLERIQLMYMSRQAWILASIMEHINIDDYVDYSVEPVPTLDAAASRKKRVKRSELRFDIVGTTIAQTVLELMVRIYQLGAPQLKAVIASCFGFFLKGQRTFVKDRRVSEIFKDALTRGDLQIRHKMLAALGSLLSFYGQEADKETRVSGKDFERKNTGPTKVTQSAVESAQPLAQFSHDVLAHITLSGKLIRCSQPGGSMIEDEVMRVRCEALVVVRLLHQQGLVNPMVILPKVFALCFTGEPSLSQQATVMLKEMLELKPTLLLNRLDEAFREAFLSIFVDRLPKRPSDALQDLTFGCMGEIYADRFRKHKVTREAFVRKALSEIFAMRSDRFRERFSRLHVTAKACATAAAQKEAAALAGRGPLDADSEDDVPLAQAAKRRKTGDDQGPNGNGDLDSTLQALQTLPGLQLYQLLYAQFICSAITSLPYQYESEPLLVIFECNRHLSLHAGNLSTCEDEAAGGEPEPKRSRVEIAPPPAAPPGENDPVVIDDDDGDENDEDLFAEAVSVLACICLKNTLRSEFGLTVEQCTQYNPRSATSERLKNVWKERVAGQRGEESDQPFAGRSRLDTTEFIRLAGPLAHTRSRAEFATYARELSEIDVWDLDTSNKGRGGGAQQPEGKSGARAPKRRGRPPNQANAGRGAKAKAKAGGARGRGKAKKAAQTEDEEEDRAEQPEAEDGMSSSSD